MRSFNARKLNEYFTFNKVTGDNEDDFGTVSHTSDVINFYGKIEKLKSNLAVDDGKVRDKQLFRVLARANAVSGLRVKDVGSYDGTTNQYSVEDIYEADVTSRGILTSFKSFVYITLKRTT